MYIPPGKMAALAPALLYFVPDLRPHVLTHLRGASPDLKAAEAELFREAVRMMKKEIEQRLEAAASAITGIFPENEYSAVMLQAPWDLIRMFNES